jgi:trigger factor
MKSKLETIENCRVKLILEFDKDDSTKAYNITIKDLSKDFKVPGFMPGKVPKSIIEEKVGKNTIQIRTVEKLVGENLQQALAEKNLDLISRPVLENSNFDFENQLSVSLILELRPTVKLPEYKGLEIDVPKAELKDVSLESLLSDLAKRLGQYVEQGPDAKVIVEDLITIDFNGRFTDGTDMPENEGKDAKVVVHPDNFAPKVMDQLVGCSAGETKELSTTFPEDYPDKEFAGKEAVFQVTVKKIERKEPLPVNEELAVKTGRKDFETLKQDLLDQMNIAKETVQKNRAKAILLHKLMSTTEVDIPEWLIDREIKVQQQSQNNQDHNHDHDHDHDHNHEAVFEDEVSPEIKSQAKNKLKFNLVLAEIARNEKVQINQDELVAFAQMWFQVRGQQFTKLQDLQPQLVNYLAEELLFEKITAWLVNSAVLNVVEETEESLKKLEDLKSEFKGLIEE